MGAPQKFLYQMSTSPISTLLRMSVQRIRSFFIRNRRMVRSLRRKDRRSEKRRQQLRRATPIASGPLTHMPIFSKTPSKQLPCPTPGLRKWRSAWKSSKTSPIQPIKVQPLPAASHEGVPSGNASGRTPPKYITL